VHPPPTINQKGTHELLAIRLLLASLAGHGPAFRRFGKRTTFDRWLGDLACEGKGEILVARS
jgi:hypothetical protein